MARAAGAGLGCRQCEACLYGNDNLFRRYTVFGYTADGGNAELLAAPEYSVIPIPGGMSFEEAAAAPLVFLTAWHMLMGRARLQPGEDVLVLAASSGVGSAAIQIARMFQCRVILPPERSKLAKARELGADYALDHYRQDISAEVKKSPGRGVDVVVEHVGQATWPKSLESLAANRLVACAPTGRCAGGPAVPLQQAVESAGVVHGYHRGTAPGVEVCVQKQLRPVVDRVYPLSEIRAAHTRLESSEQFGKVIVQCG
jgi:NADPH:quinone reductase-like Zn-dependent oxidoreductase